MILAAAIVAHFVNWGDPKVKQVGVAVDDRLILLVPSEGCSAGLRIYSGRYGELDAALSLIKTSKVCDER